MSANVDRELEAMAEDLAALRLEDRYDKTRTRTAGALARTADFTRGVRSSAGGGNRSSGVSDPTGRAAEHGTRDIAAVHLVELQDRLTRASLDLRRARAIVEMNYPVPELEDEPAAPCGNVACDHVCTGAANDRIIKPKGSDIGLCGKCRKHWERHKRHWPVNSAGRDVRTTAA